jgi:hypothetical protein
VPLLLLDQVVNPHVFHAEVVSPAAQNEIGADLVHPEALGQFHGSQHPVPWVEHGPARLVVTWQEVHLHSQIAIRVHVDLTVCRHSLHVR